MFLEERSLYKFSPLWRLLYFTNLLKENIDTKGDRPEFLRGGMSMKKLCVFKCNT